MVIAAHIWGEEIEQSLLLLALKQMASLQPRNSFIFFTNSSLKNLSENCVQVNVNPKPASKVLLYFWYNYKLPKLFIKYAVNTFISNTGMLAADVLINQFLFIEHKTLGEERNIFFKKRLNNSVTIAQTVFVTDNVIGDTISKQLSAHKSNIQQLNFSLQENNILFTLSDVEAVREKYCKGFDYYLFRIDDASKAHVVTVLKSFSQLKKWQKTSLKMILLFENDIDEKLLPDFKNYKYRNEIILIKETNANQSLLTAAAFCYIFFGNYNRVGDVYKALQYNVPVIAADTEINNLLFKLTVAYAAVSVDILARQLQLIYKDEVYRKQLLQKANIFLTQFNSDAASRKFAEIISNQ